MKCSQMPYRIARYGFGITAISMLSFDMPLPWAGNLMHTDCPVAYPSCGAGGTCVRVWCTEGDHSNKHRVVGGSINTESMSMWIVARHAPLSAFLMFHETTHTNKKVHLAQAITQCIVPWIANGTCFTMHHLRSYVTLWQNHGDMRQKHLWVVDFTPAFAITTKQVLASTVHYCMYTGRLLRRMPLRRMPLCRNNSARVWVVGFS